MRSQGQETQKHFLQIPTWEKSATIAHLSAAGVRCRVRGYRTGRGMTRQSTGVGAINVRRIAIAFYFIRQNARLGISVCNFGLLNGTFVDASDGGPHDFDQTYSRIACEDGPYS